MNNCCIQPAPPTELENALLKSPRIDGEPSFTATALSTVLSALSSAIGARDEVKESFFKALWAAFEGSTELEVYVQNALSEHDKSDGFTQLLKLQVRDVVFSDEFVSTVANKVMDNEPFVASLAGKVVDKLINDEDTLTALKQCVISSLHRCDGTSLQLGDSVATCDEMQATIAGVRDDVRRALNR